MEQMVKSINGYQGSKPFRPDPGITLDANDIHVTGSTGTTINTVMNQVAAGMTRLTLENIGNDNRKIIISNYTITE